MGNGVVDPGSACSTNIRPQGRGSDTGGKRKQNIPTRLMMFYGQNLAIRYPSVDPGAA